MKQYIDTLSPMFTGPKIDITSYQKGSIFKDEKEEKVSSTISGLKDKIDNPKDNPMMIMLKKLKEKQHANVETVVRETPSSKINQTTLTLNGKVYNINEYKKINFEHAKTVDVMRDGMLYRLRISEKNKVTIESVKPISDVKTGDQPQNILNTAVEFTGINDAIRVITGRDPITGDKVADMDRLVSGVYMVPSTNIVKVGKYVFKIIKGEKVAKKVEKKVKGIGRGEQLLDKVKTYEQARNKTVDIVGDLGPNSQPYTGTLKSSAGYGKVVGRQSADGKVRWRLDYDPKKGPHINIEDFRNGKGANARKIAIPFEGNESTFKSLLKHLNR